MIVINICYSYSSSITNKGNLMILSKFLKLQEQASQIASLYQRLTVVCETKWSETQRNEMEQNEMKICSLRNENL